MAKKQQRILVTGDHGFDRFIYVEGIGDSPPNLREAWVKAHSFWIELLKASAGSLIEYMRVAGYDAKDPFYPPPELAESVYILTRQGDEDNRRWRTGMAIVSGEREFPPANTVRIRPLSKSTYPLSVPAIFMDFHQGCLKHNEKEIPALLEGRRYIIRTHDPTKPEWVVMRKNGLDSGIWFSPLQDMFNGALNFPGNWEDIRQRVIKYLKADQTLWGSGRWKHDIVIQISYDGVLALSAKGKNSDGQLMVFAGDQPGSFSRKGLGAVIGGGIVFVASLADALFDRKSLPNCAAEGLARLRMLVDQGYQGPPPEARTDWKLNSATNLPVWSGSEIPDHDIIDYNQPPKANWETARSIVSARESGLRKATLLTMGALTTCCPNYSRTLLRLESRLRTHVKSGKGVLSFAIFGGPGSGKSFVAKQLAQAVDPTRNTFEALTINISQFSDPRRMLDALEQIQTIGLQGKTPFVLWDEFDTAYQGAQGAWLQYFLMPMQDAKFFDGMNDRSLGKSIFVFIGGTFKDANEFEKWALDPKKGKLLKGPDFHSRLDSSLDVPSVNLSAGADKAWSTPDVAKLVRALMIRVFLQKHKNVTEINQDVLAYLIHVPLKHGARSLERIITASELEKTSRFQRSHLPPADVLQLHVQGLDPGTPDHVSHCLGSLKGYNMAASDDPIPLEWRP